MKISMLMVTGCLAACTFEPPSAADAGALAADSGGASADAGSPAVVDAGLPLRLASVAASSQALSPARDHHTTLVAEVDAGAFVYVFGGTDGWETVHADVQRAQIHEAGELGGFEKIGELPEPRAGHTTVLLHGWVVLSGGITRLPGGLVLRATTSMAKLEGDGSLGPWRPGPPLPIAVMHHTCSANGSWVYCVGGRITGNFTADLAVAAALHEGGNLTGFTTLPALPTSIGFHQAFVHGTGLYVAGGLHRDPPADDFTRLDEVWRSELAADGSAGPWRQAGELPEARSTGAAEVVGDRLYLSGGMNGHDHAVASIVEGVFDSDGGVTFTPLDLTLSSGRMHLHQSPHYRQWLYWVGGQDASATSLGGIEIGTLR